MQNVDKKCTVSKKCGGCSYQGIAYSQQLKRKQMQVEELLKPFGRPDPILGMHTPWHYRNKVHHAFGMNRKNQIIHGTYAEGSHEILCTPDCLIEDEESQRIMETISILAKSFRIRIYDEDRGTGLLRRVLVRRGFQTGEVMVVLVVSSPIFPSKNNFVKALRKEHPQITTILLNINDKSTSMILGDREIVLYGKGYITDRLCGCSFRISAKSFYQVNPVQTEVLYRKAISFAKLTGKETVIDAYCGIGTIGMTAASQAAQVTGIECNPDAVRDARINAKQNQIRNIQFYQGDAGEFLTSMAEEGKHADLVFMDPPRSGSSKKFIKALQKLNPAKIVYISCNPVTLARDLQDLKKAGFRVQKIQPVDMFPWTDSIETVCLLSKLNAKQHIEVDLSMDELDLTDAEKKATYQEIKDYVIEHTGLKVSSLYIAQVKQKCGIIERENYNKPKSEDAKQPQCPPEKEKAIKEALKHFGMI